MIIRKFYSLNETKIYKLNFCWKNSFKISAGSIWNWTHYVNKTVLVLIMLFFVGRERGNSLTERNIYHDLKEGKVTQEQVQIYVNGEKSHCCLILKSPNETRFREEPACLKIFYHENFSKISNCAADRYYTSQENSSSRALSILV